MLSMKGKQEEEAVIRTILILQSAAFDANMFRSSIKRVEDCDNLCQEVAGSAS